MKRDNLIKRLKRLWKLELVNVFFLPLAFALNCFGNGQSIGLNSTSAMILNGILLLQGSYFWFQYSQVLENRRKEGGQLRVFKMFKTLNLALIPVCLLVILAVPFAGPFDRIGAYGFFTLAVLEHINYFEVQLMYDNRSDIEYLLKYRRLKRSKLKVILMDVGEEGKSKPL